MPIPFPGMDPYLEQPGIWNQIHTNLISAIQRNLAASVRPTYYVAIEQRTYLTLLPPDDQLIGMPDALVIDEAAMLPVAAGTAVAEPTEIGTLPAQEEVIERYLEVRLTETREVVTVIEILSPTNKVHADGRRKYLDKREKVLASQTSLVEIDLLRAGEPMPMYATRQTDYRVVVSRSWQRPYAAFYLWDLQEPIPDFHIPLRRNEVEPVLPLNDILHAVYNEVGYDLMINYGREAIPPLTEAQAAWVREAVSLPG